VALLLVGTGTALLLTRDGDEGVATQGAEGTVSSAPPTGNPPPTASAAPTTGEDFFVDLPEGYSYGEPSDEGRAVQGPAGQSASMIVATCVDPDANTCVARTSPLTPITIEGQRVYQYKLGDVPGVAWKPNEYELIVLSQDLTFAEDLLAIVIRDLAPEPDDYERVKVKVKAAKIFLETPKHWLEFDISKQDLESQRKALEAENPELAETIDPEVAARGTRYFAQDPLDANNVTVQVLPGILGSKSDLETELQGSSGSIPGFEVVSVDRAKVGGRKALRFSTRVQVTDLTGEAHPLYQTSLIVEKGDSKLVLVSVNVDDEAEDIQVADDIIRSIRPL
jgi:hypothetical protein